MTITLDTTLTWRDVAAVAQGAQLELSPHAWARVERASLIVERIIESGVRAYGVNTGVGALADTVVTRDHQTALSRNIVRSHAAGVGAPLAAEDVRAIITAQINNYAHGHSGVRPEVVRHYLAFLNRGLTPLAPSRGSVGYLTHNAHIALLLMGEGKAIVDGRTLDGAAALAAIGLEPLTLRAKEGLSLVNGTACATGLSCMALARAAHLLDWADAISALTLEASGAQMPAYSAEALALRSSPGIQAVGSRLRALLKDSELIEAARGKRTQDALSLRAIPHAHGAAHDVFAASSRIVDQELSSVTDNPLVAGEPDAPQVISEAHAVAPALAQASDSLAIALSQIAQMSERRMDRLVNPLVNSLPAFLASDAGSHSGFMIAQYTAVGLANETRRLAMPASTDGGVTSGLQEDFLANPTPAVNKLLTLIDNAEYIFAIELMAAAQAQDFLAPHGKRAPGTDRIQKMARAQTDHYRDDRPLAGDIETLRTLIRSVAAPLMA